MNSASAVENEGFDEEFSASETVEEMEDDDLRLNSYAPMSPFSPAESLFLMGLRTNNISAAALAHQIRVNSRSAPSSGGSVMSGVSDYASCVMTDDFVSACGDDDDIEEDLQHNSVLSNIGQRSNSGANPNSHRTSDPIIEEADTALANGFANQEDIYFGQSDGLTTPQREEEQKQLLERYRQIKEGDMSSDVKAAPLKPAPKAEEDGKMHVDAANHVYEGVKGAWSWGKGLMLVSNVLGAAECVANSVVGVVGTNLEDIDKNIIKPNIDNLDTAVLNPAVNGVVGVVLGAASKSEEIFKPIVVSLLKPVGLIKNEPEPENVSKKVADKQNDGGMAPEYTRATS